MGLGVMSADGKHNPTSTIHQHSSRGTDRPKLKNIFSTFVTLAEQRSGLMNFKCRHNKPSPDRCTPLNPTQLETS